MQLRRFQADSAPLALDAIRRAFGDDAVILSNRQVDDHVEMIATGHIDEESLASAVLDEAVDALREEPKEATSTEAVEVKPTTEPAQSTVQSPAQTEAQTEAPASPAVAAEPVPQTAVESAVTDSASSAVRSAVFPTVAAEDLPTETDVALSQSASDVKPSHVVEPVIELAVEPAAAPVPEPEPVPVPEQARVRVTVDDDLVPRLETLVSIDSESRGQPCQTAPEPTSIATDESTDASASNDQTKESAFSQEAHAGIERIEQRMQRLEANLWGELEPLKNAHIEQLLKIGIGAELAVRLVERLGPDDTTETAIRQSLSLLGASLPIGVDTTTTEPGVTVVSGPSGCGKTTAVLKLARHHVQAHGVDSVVLISADTRSGVAFEALQFHGTSLGVPVVQARNPRELGNLIGAFSSKSLVLVDHMPLDHPEAFTLPVLAADDARTLRHLLVLSANMQACALEAQASLHKQKGVTNLVLTQLDSVARLGSCFAPLIRQHLPIAYWSDSAETTVPLQRAAASVLVATAMATARKFTASADELCQLNLMRPTRHNVSCDLFSSSGTRLDATATPPTIAPVELG